MHCSVLAAASGAHAHWGVSRNEGFRSSSCNAKPKVVSLLEGISFHMHPRRGEASVMSFTSQSVQALEVMMVSSVWGCSLGFADFAAWRDVCLHVVWRV